jgi:hypothetical protein
MSRQADVRRWTGSAFVPGAWVDDVAVVERHPLGGG